MTELKLYRFLMTCLLIVAGIIAIKSYGDHRVNEFLARGTTPAMGVAKAPPPASNFPSYARPSSGASLPLRQPPAADPWRVVESPAGASAPWAVNQGRQGSLRSADDPQSLGARPIAPAAAAKPAPAVTQDEPVENPMVVQVRELRKRLGGVGVADILGAEGGFSGDFDAEAVFAETIESLQSRASNATEALATREQESSELSEQASSQSHRELTPEEIAQARIELELFAEMLKPVQPKRAEACLQLAERFRQRAAPEPSQKR